MAERPLTSAAVMEHERRVRLVALDLDGTLLSPRGEVTPRTARAVRRLIDAGVVCIPATGRSWWESRRHLNSAGLVPTQAGLVPAQAGLVPTQARVEGSPSDDGAAGGTVQTRMGMGVFVNGAVVHSTADGRTVARSVMEPAVVREIAARIEALGLPAMVISDVRESAVDPAKDGGVSDGVVSDSAASEGAASEGVVTPEYVTSSGVPIPPSLAYWFERHQPDVLFASDMARRDWPAALRIGTIASAEVVDRLGATLNLPVAEGGLRGRCHWHVINVPAYGVVVLEVFAAGVTKWTGIEQVIRRLGIDASEVAAFGDDVNDIDMLRNAGLGLAMGNAVEQAKQAARGVIGHHKDDGLAEALEILADRLDR